MSMLYASRQPHKQSHVDGRDAFEATDVLESIGKRLQTTTGPTTMLMGAVADGEFLKRSGTGVIGATAGGVFGSEFSQGSSDGESNTSSSTFQQKLRHTTGSLPSGNYLIQYQYELETITNAETEAQVQINDTTTIAQTNAFMSSDIYDLHSGFYYAAGISGVQNIDIDYRALAETASIKRARVMVWRIN